MSARRREVELGLARGRRLVIDLCRDLDAAREASGLSYAAMARAIGLSGDQVARVCKGAAPSVSLVQLTTHLATVGLELSARAFPAGLPIRDAAHVALLMRLKARLSTALTWRLEVPVIDRSGTMLTGVPTDRRAWDAVIGGGPWSIGVEAETRLGDIQALLRRLALKRRDGSVDTLILLVNDTDRNRRVLALESALFVGQFTVTTREALRCLASGARPPADALIVL